MLLFDRAPFATGRVDFAEFLNQRGLCGEAAEIGVNRGDFARPFLDAWRGRFYYLIDHYPPDYDPTDLVCQADRRGDQEAVWSAIGRHASRVQQVLEASAEAVKTFSDGCLDFVYVDACHQYESVRQDLRLWWPKVRWSGVLAGHDFLCPGEVGGGHGSSVQRAVVEHAQEVGATIHLVIESSGEPWSYYFVKL